MVDTTSIGHEFAPRVTSVDADRLRLFAKATGEARPQYVDEAAARAAGHPSLPAPPTYAACLSMDEADPFAWMRELGIDVGRVLHAAQAFRYFAPIHAGDCLTFTSRVANVLQKKSGSRTFVVKVTDITNQHGVRVAEMRSTIVVRGD
jgi:acyl dehydratase